MKRFAVTYKRHFLQAILVMVILLLSIALFNTIYRPVKATREIEERKKDVISRLYDIRKAQLHYKSVYGQYAGDFTTLIAFVNSGSIPVIRMIHDPSDSTFTMTISDTIRRVAASDSLFPGMPELMADSLRFIPHSGGIEFDMEAGQTERNGVTINVFEVSAAYKDFLRGISDRYYDVYGGLILGSMTEPLTNGNWE
jgi:hypothetical protein